MGKQGDGSFASFCIGALEVYYGIEYLEINSADAAKQGICDGDEVAINKLNNPARDSIANIPEFKVCAFKVEKQHRMIKKDCRGS